MLLKRPKLTGTRQPCRAQKRPWGKDKQLYPQTEWSCFFQTVFFLGGFPTKILRFEEHLIRFSVKFFEIRFLQLAHWYMSRILFWTFGISISHMGSSWYEQKRGMWKNPTRPYLPAEDHILGWSHQTWPKNMEVHFPWLSQNSTIPSGYLT